MNIIGAISDRQLFRPFLADKDGKLTTWRNWGTALKVLYGLKVKPRHADLIKSCTGRDIATLPSSGFDVALFLTGRRSGKSKIAAVVGAFEACLSGREKLLSPGELGMVAIVAPGKRQGRIVKNYLRAIFELTPLLKQEVVNETQEGFELSNGILVEILIGDFRTIRGYTLIACIVDELCFFGVDVESKVKSDTELIRAILPSLATTGGRLIGISNHYAKRGWAYRQHKKNFGNNSSPVLIWNAASRTMNSTLPESVVTAALAEDRAAALSAYCGEFRDDISIWLPLEVIEAVVKKNRRELLPRTGEKYYGFVDISGGRISSASLAIAHAHKEETETEKRVIIDCVQEYRAPFSPFKVIQTMCGKLKKFSIRRVIGDNYSGQFCADAFRRNGIAYDRSKLPKSALFLELIPRICSQEIELLDDETLIKQLSSLERRTHSGGKDVVAAPQGQLDDMANAVSGVSHFAGKRKKIVGGIPGFGGQQNRVATMVQQLPNLRILAG